MKMLSWCLFSTSYFWKGCFLAPPEWPSSTHITIGKLYLIEGIQKENTVGCWFEHIQRWIWLDSMIDTQAIIPDQSSNFPLSSRIELSEHRYRPEAVDFDVLFKFKTAPMVARQVTLATQLTADCSASTMWPRLSAYFPEHPAKSLWRFGSNWDMTNGWYIISLPAGQLY